ncbi:MAG: MFS transporter [Chloroflexi bacterium]|nr:MFS transporter [Chloroflexota bacterium]
MTTGAQGGGTAQDVGSAGSPRGSDPSRATSIFGRVFYGWWIVGGAVLLQGLSGVFLLHSFGAYLVYLQSEFGWSRTLIAGAYSLSRVESGLIGPLQGWLINRLGARTVIRIGIVLFGLGFILLSMINSASTFYAVFVVIAIGSSLGGFVTANIVLANWFERRRARAMALAATGTSLSGLLVPAVAWALGSTGWRGTAFASGLLILLIGLPVSQLFRQAPEPYGYAPDGSRGGDAPATPRGADQSPQRPIVGGVTARDALRSPAFWLLSGGHSAALVAITAVTVHLIPYLVEQGGMAIEAAAGVVAIVTSASLVGQLISGLIGDRLDKRLVAMVCMAGHTLALLALSQAAALPLIFAVAAVHGLAWGTRGPLMMAIRADYFGRRAFATIEGFSALVTMIGTFVGPVFVGFVADRFGDYRVGFLLLSAVTASGMLLFGLARRPA